jgi:hypothetical protein
MNQKYIRNTFEAWRTDNFMSLQASTLGHSREIGALSQMYFSIECNVQHALYRSFLMCANFLKLILLMCHRVCPIRFERFVIVFRSTLGSSHVELHTLLGNCPVLFEDYVLFQPLIRIKNIIHSGAVAAHDLIAGVRLEILALISIGMRCG